jgi:cytoskeletal protein CcmA (bactofilin family)/predicted RNA-binding Zn-ribbon protein involved in translation (DUF1610 family)
MEPTSGFSTYCRKCAQYFKIEPPAKSTGSGFFSRLIHPGKSSAPPSTISRPPSMPLQVLGFSEEADLVAQSQPSAARAPQEQKSYRHVICFDCQHHHKVSTHSTSSLCPNCGSYIDLRDVVIKDRSAQRIRTRGDVFVEKKGALLGTSITCGNLIVEGQVAGSIQASGQVTFRASGKVLGEVRCQHLSVEKKCEVHFLQPIHCETAEIYGQVQGHICLSDRIFLNRKASWQGTLSAKTALMEAGAKLAGAVEILPRPLAPPPLFSRAAARAKPGAEIQSTRSDPEASASGVSPAESLADWAAEGPLATEGER